MRRYLLNKRLTNNHGEITIDHQFCHLNLSTMTESSSSVTISASSDLLVTCGPAPKPLYLLLNKGVRVKLQIIAPTETIDWLLNIALDESSCLDVTMADFGSYSGTITVNGELYGLHSHLKWHLACLARSNENKKYIVNFNHKAEDTQAIMTNFGVLEDAAKLTFTGTGHIFRGAIQSQTHQHARIMVFDEMCRGQADPILAIDENDVGASHAATVGKINEDHLFYLKSRGLTEVAARKLITYGYLKPAIASFNDLKAQQHLKALLEARI